MTNNKPNVVLLNKETKTAYLIDVAIPNYNNMLDAYQEKKAKFAELTIEVQQMWQLDKIYTDHRIIDRIDTEMPILQLPKLRSNQHRAARRSG